LQIRKGDITAATISNLTDFTARTLEIRAGIKKPETNYIKEAKRYAHIVTTTWELDVLLTAL
jgi:hypothetical protein